jgi:hypothetical protein
MTTGRLRGTPPVGVRFAVHMLVATAEPLGVADEAAGCWGEAFRAMS